MTAEVGDEEYWESSEIIGLSFKEETPISATSFFQPTKNNARDKPPEPILSFASFFNSSDHKTGAKPLQSLVSKRSLIAILGEETKKDTTTQSIWDVPPTSVTIRAITLGKPFSLHAYRTLEHKSLLLEEAVKSKNGDAILCVVLFLKKTLNSKLFLRLIQLQPNASPGYINYLTTRFEARAAVELHLRLGQARDAAMTDFRFSVQPQHSLEKRLAKLKALLRDHFSTPDAEDTSFVENFLKFVEWQISVNAKSTELLGTVASALSHLLTNNWSEARSQPLSPYNFSALLSVSDRMMNWKAITARAAVEDWNSILDLLLTKGWLGAKKLKTVITPERIVMELHKHRAPEQILSEFLALVDTAEKQLELAKKLAWHRAVLDTLVSMKDRQGLVQYQAALNPQSNDYIVAETALRNNIKWKN